MSTIDTAYGRLLDPAGRVIGTLDDPREPSRTHRCWPGCPLHDPCCPPYRTSGWDHAGDCRLTGGAS
jgi:hypothetical protein